MTVFDLCWVIAIPIDARGKHIPASDENRTNTPLLVGCPIADVNG